MRYIVLVARLVLGFVFLYASIHKILDPASFAQAVRNYQMIPPEYSNLVALTLPWVELFTGLLLLAGAETQAAALVAAGMVAVFIVALFHAYSTGLDINCGCFSSASDPGGRIGPLTLLRDVSLLPLALVILFLDRGDFSLGPRLKSALPRGSG
jgi:uncharacterized membrane protein YphA (DoxX/SURF4 family)